MVEYFRTKRSGKPFVIKRDSIYNFNETGFAAGLASSSKIYAQAKWSI